jgi:hypothetical protein
MRPPTIDGWHRPGEPEPCWPVRNCKAWLHSASSTSWTRFSTTPPRRTVTPSPPPSGPGAPSSSKASLTVAGTVGTRSLITTIIDRPDGAVHRRVHSTSGDPPTRRLVIPPPRRDAPRSGETAARSAHQSAVGDTMSSVTIGGAGTRRGRASSQDAPPRACARKASAWPWRRAESALRARAVAACWTA